MQDAQVGERFRGFPQLLARRAAVGKFRGEQPDDQKSDDVKRDDLDGFGSFGRRAAAGRGDDRRSGQNREQREQKNADRRAQERFGRAQKSARNGTCKLAF